MTPTKINQQPQPQPQPENSLSVASDVNIIKDIISMPIPINKILQNVIK